MLTKFHSYETGEAFTECCDCGCNLHDVDIYIINQSFAANECIFECAMCLQCRERMNEQLSENSRVAMFDFMHDHADMESRQNRLSNNSATEAYIENCIICDDCEGKIAASISDETRKFWDDYIAEHFPGPPSEIDLPNKSKPILI